MGHLTGRTSNIWTSSFSSSDSYVDNRRSGWSYDADGNLLSGPNTYAYDAGGEINTIDVLNAAGATARFVDGDGQQVKTENSVFDEQTSSWVTTTTYYLRSSVLQGRVLTEIDANGAKQRTFVYANGSMLAWQKFYGSVPAVIFEHRDPSGASFRTTNSEGNAGSEPDELLAELDPTGANAVVLPPPEPPQGDNDTLTPYPTFGDPRNPGMTYTVDGIRVPADYFMQLVDSAFHGSLGLVEAVARASARVVGLRNTAVSYGRRFEVIYDENGGISVKWGNFDPHLAQINYGDVTPIYGDSWNLNLLLTPQKTRITSDGVRSSLNSCLEDLFAVSLTSLIPSEKGKSGSAIVNFVDPNRRLNGLTGFGVVNDVTSFSAYTLGFFGHTESSAGLTSTERTVRDGSQVFHFEPHTNYTANNLDKIRLLDPRLGNLVGKHLAVQIHELGNSIDIITNQSVGDRNSNVDRDSGYQLELCVLRRVTGK